VSLGALVTLDVHGRDVIQNLVDAEVQQAGDFEWSAQLRCFIGLAFAGARALHPYNVH
jgi:dynein heavy chain